VLVISTTFQEPPIFKDGDLELRLRERRRAVPEKGWVPTYRFDMMVDGEVAGTIDLRLGATPAMVNFGGQIAYGVEPSYRGRRYAARSLRLLLPLAAAHGMTELWITCNPENWASRRTCEIVGAELVAIVDLPPDSDMYIEGERQKCRYRLPTSPGG